MVSLPSCLQSLALRVRWPVVKVAELAVPLVAWWAVLAVAY
jgi:hypothetical protein